MRNTRRLISLHANAFNETANGTETLYFHTSTQGKKLVEVEQRHLLDALDLSDRKLKPVTSAGRGGTVGWHACACGDR